jgi:hypothetical protein
VGEVDIENLFRVYDAANSIIKKHSLLISFKIDHGTYETAIEFIGSKPYHPPLSESWEQNPIIFCPDLLDYYNKIIIEYEEEVGKRRAGAKLAKKGHHREGDMDTKRDIRRTRYYRDGGFRVLRIYEADVMWQKKLVEFLIDLDANNT